MAHEVLFRCRLSETCGSLHHAWEHTVGSGHAALALRADWQAQLKRCHDELGFRHVRFHAILSDSMGTLVCEQDQLIYSFLNADRIFDFLVSIGMKPFVELSFMPEALASGHQTVFHYRANVTPPRKYDDWAELVRKLATHWIERYGLREVRTWLFEVWNEPNLKSFWPATQRQYFKLYRTTALALKSVDDRLRVGGPATADNEWIGEFVRFVDSQRVPADFITTHHYPTDAQGSDQEDTAEELSHVPRSTLRQWAQDTRRRTGGRPLYYTEWSTSSDPHDPLHDEPYSAPVIVKTMMEANALTEGYSYWTFSDIFSENYFPSVPFHGGFGLLNLYGIAKPSYRAFQLLHALGERQVLVDGLHPTVDCWVVEGDQSAIVLLTNHAPPHHHIRHERVRVAIESPRRPAGAYVERIDQEHAHARRAWIRMGSPGYLSGEQVRRLNGASEMSRQPLSCVSAHGVMHLHLTLPPHAVAAVTIKLRPARSDRGSAHAQATRQP